MRPSWRDAVAAPPGRRVVQAALVVPAGPGAVPATRTILRWTSQRLSADRKTAALVAVAVVARRPRAVRVAEAVAVPLQLLPAAPGAMRS